MPLAKKNLLKKDTLNTTITKPDTLTVKEVVEPKSLMAQLSFANETLPLGDKKVERKMKKILAAHSFASTQTNRLHRKAAEWFPVVEPILAAYGIPNDFKYLMLVESGLQGGVSPKGAAGIWQFMPGTARMYGLKVNGKIDERYNLRKSTIAACKYIKEMYQGLESWTLVAAAYNVGDVKLRRQINRQNQDNYYKMKLNRETGGYVYKVISMKQILEHPVRYGYDKPKQLLAFNAE
ncbi:lytic transglycosylase domain-containing protein [Pedobacter sp. MW01-1-1]|uniref:lytic transglycosylase domain-containing protein n=1 Tax=Pedobacter sp. MW01-1-1 TaxID=3383027 RepID=UPI003FEF621C